MGDLTKNISRHEVECKCGCGQDVADFVTVNIIQQVCDHFNCSVTITSWNRCLIYNRAIGSNDTSQHPKGKGADCQFRGISPTLVAAYLDQEYPDTLGVGVYDDFIHIDSRTEKARW